ncbi:MAG: type II secretion system protein GspG [Phycisphaeraceae bacterium]|nr:type II secretion system protein GspG [Phycisphaeraceae bacterium]
MSQQGHWYSEGAPPTDSPLPPPRVNGLGIAGFVVGLIGLCGCLGLLSPIGLILSLFALTRAPRGWAIAGTVVSAIGCCCLLPMGLPLVLVATGVVSVSAFAIWIVNTFGLGPEGKTALFASIVAAMISIYYAQNGVLPPTLDDLDLAPEILRDGWGQPFVYEITDQGGFVLRTLGADGKEGTADDFELEGVLQGGSLQIQPRPRRLPVVPTAPADSAAPPDPTGESAP